MAYSIDVNKEDNNDYNKNASFIDRKIMIIKMAVGNDNNNINKNKFYKSHSRWLLINPVIMS